MQCREDCGAEEHVNKSFKLLSCFVMISTFGLLPEAVFGENSAAVQVDAPYFSNKDVEQYKMPSDNKTTNAKMNKTGTNEEKAKEKKEQQDQEYWCKKATSYKRKVEKSQDEVSEIEKELSAEDLSRKKKVPLEKRLKKAQKQLTYTERDLADFEEEAHRKDIPPGWLRCQFE